jgi:hypothetical protein
MTDSAPPDRPRPETDEILTDRNQGPAERAVLGRNPYGSIIRIVLAVAVFIALFGTIFFLNNQ